MVLKHNKNNSDYSMFLNPIATRFSFLESEYGFQMGLSRISGREFIVDFIKRTVGILFTCEPQSLPAINVYSTTNTNILYHPLSSLSRLPLQQHYKHLKPNYTNEVEYACAYDLCLKAHAELLREYGEKFLRGDPSDLHGIRPRQYNVLRHKK